MTATSFLRSLAVLALTLASGWAVAGCDHALEPDGPRLVDQFGPFAILEGLEVNRDTVSFTENQSVVFTALFSKQVDWVIEITGQESGAVKRIEGFSAEVSPENARWAGSTTELPLFRNETVEAAIFVPSENSDTTRATVDVTATRAYPGEVAADFEEDDDAVLFLGNFEFDFDLMLTGRRVNTGIPAGEGEAFYRLTGTDRTLNNFFVGLLQITSPNADGYFTVPTTVPENLFFNSFLYNFGDENTLVVLELIEDTNGNGVFNDGVDSIFGTGGFRLEQPGWNLFSRSAAEFGLSEEQAARIVAIRAVLISDNNTQPDPRLPVEFGIDYITFTAGGPLEL